MTRKSRRSKNIDWSTVSAEDWAKGHVHVAAMLGVTRGAAWYGRKNLIMGPRVRHPAPDGLKPTDSPTAVAKAHGVSTYIAGKWLTAIGRPYGYRSKKPPRPSEPKPAKRRMKPAKPVKPAKRGTEPEKWDFDPDRTLDLIRATWSGTVSDED